MSLQAKVILALTGMCLSLLACLGSYWYGVSTGEALEQGRWATREAGRAAKTATVAIQHTGTIVKEVKRDNEIERKANERAETALAELASYRTANRALVAANGGLRVSAAACTGRDRVAGETEATGAGVSTGTDPGTIALPQQVDADLQDQADEADIILERYRVLRSWCFDQGFCKLNTSVPEPAS